MSYAAHLRKSRADLEAERRGEGESLARHRKTLHDLADRLGITIEEEYCEIVSGSRLSERPEMQRLLRDVAAGRWDGVLDVEVARLTRGDLMDQGLIVNTFKYSGTKVITPQHTYDLTDDWDEDVITSDMSMSRREYKFINRRLQHGRTASAAEGLWQSPAPFGYRKVKIQRGKGYTLEPDPDQAPLVRMIFEMYVNEHVGCATIARRLNDLGSRTNAGRPWSNSSVLQLVRNPVYIGRVRWNDRTSVTRMVDGQVVTRREKNAAPIISAGKHPAIISEDLFDAAARARRSNDKTHTHAFAPTRNPLSGLVVCGVCGKMLIRKDNCGSRGSKYDMLHCTTPDCPTCATAISIVEQLILDAIGSWSLMPEIDDRQEQRDQAHRAAIDAAQAHLDKLTAQRARIYAAFEDGAYDSATFVARRSAKDEEIAAAQSALDQLAKGAPLTPEQIIRKQLPQIRRILDLYPTLSDPREKNLLLKTVISRVVYTKPQRSYRGQDPTEHLTLDIFPVTPD
ncbi:MAG: recombinase family protein [Clostridia bacterium]|nr:recombinase family protein [Clostridia bacterium]